MALPQSNATVVTVTGAGTADDWDRGADPPGAPKWSGEVRGYYRETTERVVGAAGADVLEVRELILRTFDADLMALDTDDVITFARDGSTDALTGTAQAIRRGALDGVPRRMQTTKLTLEVA